MHDGLEWPCPHTHGKDLWGTSAPWRVRFTDDKRHSHLLSSQSAGLSPRNLLAQATMTVGVLGAAFASVPCMASWLPSEPGLLDPRRLSTRQRRPWGRSGPAGSSARVYPYRNVSKTAPTVSVSANNAPAITQCQVRSSVAASSRSRWLSTIQLPSSVSSPHRWKSCGPRIMRRGRE
jgi:hypothetical protein